MLYKPEGSLDRPICLIGEAPAKEEMREGGPFRGQAGIVLNECLHYAGIIRRDCYLTNVFDFPIYKKGSGERSDRLYRAGDDTLLFSGSKFTLEGLKSRDRLLDEIRNCKANVYVTMGNPAMYALLERVGITKWRGSILRGPNGRKVIPVIHPAATLVGRGPFEWRSLIKLDLKRVALQSKFSQIEPIPYEFSLHPSFDECISFLRYIKDNKRQFAYDIEVANHQISRISFAISSYRCITIPFNSRKLTEEEELELWLWVADVMEDEEIEKIGHNSCMFDNWFFIDRNHIFPKGVVKDTMIAWSLMYPEFEKSLALITSLFTEQPYYKDMVKHGRVENEYG